MRVEVLGTMVDHDGYPFLRVRLDGETSLRGVGFSQDPCSWLGWIGLSQRLPHKFRHGRATYALKRCKDVGARLCWRKVGFARR